ncbi:MAG: DNA-processing protein DprA [Muribaculaceae bacterium]|nr:DNA-processing protein DprA [Muribaculaceae bacterium]
MNNALLFRIAFASVRGMGIDLAHKILDVLPDEEAFFAIPERELRQLTGSSARMCGAAYRRSLLERAEREIMFIEQKNIRATYYTDPDYPRRLAEANDAPLMLYSTGDCDLNAPHIVSIVGTRHATAYGISFTDALVHDLGAAVPGVVVVSGLAYGIDIAAHRASLKHQVPTVAVLAQGLNKIYPALHRRDAAEIVHRHGAVVTDYQSQDDIHKGNFLARNRIIAALSDCTIVVESAPSGGALVTASLAQSYNRDVMAVPGRVGDEFSRGCNKLIGSNRALSITSAQDVVEAMRWQSALPSPTPPTQCELFPTLTADEQAVVDALRQHGDMHASQLADVLGKPVYKLMSILVDLDCQGIINTLPGCHYALR